mmetsp:Transcript_20230/g.29886  ORF Transcript_20230/g.29886 Transcript_20230/m.29886 type:complete len:155 (+) Transcript_20230:477-941(+)|eukprot:CAMPEP_0171453718 /NCGR_PEP_ID=MMETSP0945-20130129/1308_1 /TAXON_ID=109269 /ORGANISM="Vaucheria litorea, Strain CCMP2940" /LENGTH=154 /DNA_ID=CAMNT_0011978629 /DNA_START=445 /DNA_END=909 /DNA_ORIENTATION=-
MAPLWNITQSVNQMFAQCEHKPEITDNFVCSPFTYVSRDESIESLPLSYPDLRSRYQSPENSDGEAIDIPVKECRNEIEFKATFEKDYRIRDWQMYFRLLKHGGKVIPSPAEEDALTEMMEGLESVDYSAPYNGIERIESIIDENDCLMFGIEL